MVNRRTSDELQDEGMTLVELLVSMAMLMIALVLFGLALYITQRSAQQSSSYSRANNAVHLALQDIDRQVRSGYVVSDAPIGSVLKGWAVRIYTESSGVPRCVAWAVAPGPAPSTTLALYTIDWPGAKTALEAAVPSSVTKAPWRFVTDGLVAQKVGTDGVSTLPHAFSVVDPSGLDIMNSLDIAFWLLASPREGAGELKVTELSSSFTSRNEPRATDTVVGSITSKSKAAACA